MSSKAQVLNRRYHVHVPGLIYAGLTVMLVLGAINTQNNLLFWAFGLAVAGIMVSGFISGAALMGLSISREVVRPAQAGMPMVVRYHLSSASRFVGCFALTIEELGVPDSARHAGRSANFGSFTGPIVAFADHVPARMSAVAEARVVAWRPGELVLDAVRVSTTFPFGLTLKSVVFAAREVVPIRPAPVALSKGVERRLVDAGELGDRSRSRRGMGQEFFALREYVPGDSPRTIAWRPSARAGELLVRDTAQLGPRRVWLRLPAAMRELPIGERERVASLAAALCRRFAGLDMDVGLAAPELGVAVHPRRGIAQVERLLDVLGSAADPAGPAAPIAWRPGRLERDQIVWVGGVGGGPRDAVADPADATLVDPRAWAALPGPPPPRVVRFPGWLERRPKLVRLVNTLGLRPTFELKPKGEDAA